MEIKGILSQRGFDRNYYMQIVYEWEDAISEALHQPVLNDFHSDSFIINGLRRRFPIIAKALKPSVPVFAFEMWLDRPWGNNRRNIVPLQVDLWVRSDAEISNFCRQRSKSPVVLVSSKEMFEFLVSKGCRLPLRHCALSLPDKWYVPDIKVFKKKYDLILLGRQNSVLNEWVRMYKCAHPDFSLLRRIESGGRFELVNDEGVPVSPINTREQYMSAMRDSRCQLYSTPSQDRPDDYYTNGYNQVTPRFLECVACGCHVFARYPKNPDTDFYGLSQIAPCLESYDQFRERMDWARVTPADSALYASFLKRHLTSVRASEIVSIVKEVA